MKNCPNCGSKKIYQEVSIIAKQIVSTGKIIDVDKENIDNIFEPYYCKDCGWSDLQTVWHKSTKHV